MLSARTSRHIEHSGCRVSGRAGDWKSRLAAAAAEMVETSESVVLELIGSPFHTDAGLHPVRTLLERRCGIDRGTDQAERLRLLDAEVGASGLDPRSTVPLLAPVLWASKPRPATSRWLPRAESSTS